MGKIKFDKYQKIIFDEFSQNQDLREKFYFTGGTALSVFYLGHRISEDMDFFAEKNFSNDPILFFVENLAQKYGLRQDFTQIEQTRMFNLAKNGYKVAKIDFNYYPFRRLKESKIVNGVEVDNIKDIAINKLISINQRADVKDFVDLYFLRDTLTIWELMEGVKRKFGFEMDPVLIASNFLKVEEFDFLPRMLIPLSVSDLQDYFKKETQELAQTFTK
ncbi:MAG: nucleotidyl transferase AbiEii/AbiGii toxin family protein [Candidatus Cloacimonetes bacterium]|nr:nucleotidyl transferase AbiEii/AbiGii toxin family protein [Candidatus Cloacimonadota bacterium]